MSGSTKDSLRPPESTRPFSSVVTRPFSPETVSVAPASIRKSLAEARRFDGHHDIALWGRVVADQLEAWRLGHRLARQANTLAVQSPVAIGLFPKPRHSRVDNESVRSSGVRARLQPPFAAPGGGPRPRVAEPRSGERQRETSIRLAAAAAFTPATILKAPGKPAFEVGLHSQSRFPALQCAPSPSYCCCANRSRWKSLGVYLTLTAMNASGEFPRLIRRRTLVRPDLRAPSTPAITCAGSLTDWLLTDMMRSPR